MKFVSKQNNYRVVLRPGSMGNRDAGIPPTPGLYVRFSNGLATVDKEELIDLMLKHPKFNTDFVTKEEGARDPYETRRAPVEPEHNVTEIVYGHVGKSLNPKPRLELNPEQKLLVEEMAKSMAQEMVKEMAPTLAKELIANAIKEKDKKSPGRPKKNDTESNKVTTAQASEEVDIVNTPVVGKNDEK